MSYALVIFPAAGIQAAGDGKLGAFVQEIFDVLDTSVPEDDGVPLGFLYLFAQADR